MNNFYLAQIQSPKNENIHKIISRFDNVRVY